MELSGSHTFAAPRPVVWQVLTDPDTLRRTLPGCQKFDAQPDGSYQVMMTIGIAAIKGTYTGTVHLLDEQPPNSYTLKVVGQRRGRVCGRARPFHAGTRGAGDGERSSATPAPPRSAAKSPASVNA